jgi:cyanophycinase
VVRILLGLLLLANSVHAAAAGPPHGSLVIVGGGMIGPEILERFIQLAGGPQAPVVVIPTAEDGDPKLDPAATFLAKAGMTRVTVLHTRDPKVANSKEFVAPLKAARGVWFPGGRQWRLVDSYLNTRTEREIHRVLERGGVVGGSSAGATIQGSYLVRGAREGNTLMMAPGYERGFSLFRGVAIDQHLITRHREDDLLPVIDAHPDLLGIGIDESTAIIVQRHRFEVAGSSKVAIYDAKYKPEPGAKRYYFLSSGDRFDLAHRQLIAAPK